MSQEAKRLTAAKSMQDEAATLQCPNDLCQTYNSQVDKFCQQCGTPLIKRYLWAVGTDTAALKPEHVIANRYLLKSNQIFLDTKPGLPPQNLTVEIPKAIRPYLRLVPYRLHVPQVYAIVPPIEGATTDVLLLEQAPIYTDAVSLEGQLMPELSSVWQESTSMRQLNWLWQIAQLWQPLSSEGVASTLLDLRLLRVEGSLVRLLQLQTDPSQTPTLSQLGQLWSQLAALAKPSIAKFLEHLCLCLGQGELQTAEQLMAILDQGLIEVGRSQARTLSIATWTDKGPSRQRNEDACYPVSGTTITQATDLQSLAITCDGIGGHEGGSVASNLAIGALQSQVQQLQLDKAYIDATTFVNDLEVAICRANDQISQRNDLEHRYGRQRMGTTLVMALGHAHEICIAHVGDSRAYRVTRNACHQVTLDDDVASREVRLGYALYRDALQHSSSGSLVQALGMSASVSLHPTVQRFILDEDCVFLLCSDGLSDYERVEQSWQTEILPILDNQLDVMTAGSRLIEIANTQNGHDNVTVCLLYYQVNSFEPEARLNPSLIKVCDFSVPSPAATLEDNLIPPISATSSPRLLRRPLSLILLAFILLLSLSYGLFLYLRSAHLPTPKPSESAKSSLP